jgi:putative FmdB family regulatory protein
MPTYEYRCDACGHEFELYQQMTAPVKRKCPACGRPKLHRLIGTGGGVIFKGSGFYETDYRSDSYKKAAEADRKSTEPVKAAKTNPDTAAVKPAAESGNAGESLAKNPVKKSAAKPVAKKRRG